MHKKENLGGKQNFQNNLQGREHQRHERRGVKINKRELSPIGKVIKKRLIDINKSQIWLAKKVGMNEKYLHLVLYGERSGQKYLPDIIKVLGLDQELIKEIA